MAGPAAVVARLGPPGGGPIVERMTRIELAFSAWMAV